MNKQKLRDRAVKIAVEFGAVAKILGYEESQTTDPEYLKNVQRAYSSKMAEILTMYDDLINDQQDEDGYSPATRKCVDNCNERINKS